MTLSTPQQTQNTLSSKDIQSIQLADGWHNVSDCELVSSFEITNSPATGNGYPYLKYKLNGKTVFTSMRNVISVSTNRQSGSSSEFSQNQ